MCSCFKNIIANCLKRVVLASSVAALMFGSRDNGAFTDQDWTDLLRTDLSPLVKSKSVVEAAAWDYAEQN